ncbi:hypothetical protein BGX38DRAFT_1276598 [Terfezia claveryi]|nr:hypothetical protein BGX38DRAFT_1276598 [Terfezia claveryi]
MRSYYLRTRASEARLPNRPGGDTDLSIVESILEEDDLLRGELRAALANSFKATLEEWGGKLDKDDVWETRLSEKERTIGGGPYGDIGRLEKEVVQLRLEKESWDEREEWVGNQLMLVSERRKWEGTVEDAVQTKIVIEQRGARDCEDVAMADRSDMYEDISAYEDEDEAPVAVAPPITKKQAAPRPAAKAEKKS